MTPNTLLDITAAPTPADPKADSAPLTNILPGEAPVLQYGDQLLDHRLEVAHGA